MTIHSEEREAVRKIRAGFIPVCWLHPDDVKCALDKPKLKLSRKDFEAIAGKVLNSLVDDNYWAVIKQSYEWVKE